MMKQHRVWLIFLLTLSLLGLVACTSASPSEQDETILEEKETTIPEQEEAVSEPGEEGTEDTPVDEVATSPEEDDVVNEPAPRYAVHPSLYYIYEVSDEGDEKKEGEKLALLTFDDTPTGEATYDILDTLDRYDAKAIFFVNGHYAERNVDTLHEIKDRGHLIGNHTWWHIYIRKEDPETVRDEIVRLNDFLEQELGERPTYFRPPTIK
ncbi:polysaccharide deacetylase family protein [Bacillus horti]|uniref:NodB homology domain-containing protein n=1 Tax=Caldalkalibacillus horti TaxID=77523 RepID=A0ABT9W637_9BACI|nr:polysaccharide deacetylase family protein [Bacillus horti]MDQ0168529.1 hypothetical protein [Bacillus horti]